MFVKYAYRLNGNPYCVLPFDKTNFYNLIKACTLATIETIDNKIQVSYLYEYLNNLNAKMIIIESDYIDKAYLEDYSEYYIKCFKKYQREVNRLHFFSCEFGKDDLDKILVNGDKEKISIIKSSYLGFVTIKKLPNNFIGNTCLKTFNDRTSRYYTSLRTYKENLFGIDLKVKALAFQEQDSTVSACATSALWSIFHSTGKLFQHAILSPVEITQLATKNAYSDTRIFPNKSLNLYMIAQGIKSIGLEPYKIEVNEENILKASVYAYLRANIPMLMGFGLLNIETRDLLNIGHAVAVIGYNIDEKKLTSFSPFKLKSNQINKLYVHDDQVGPYAKMSFEHAKVKEIDRTWVLSTSFGRSGDSDKYKSIPWAVSIPLYKNIRIPFNSILNQVFTFNELLNYFSNVLNKNWDFEWDIYLNSVEQFKSNILTNLADDIENIHHILTRRLPSYIWCCELYLNGKVIMNILFDATDIEFNLNLIDVVLYKSANQEAIYNIIVDLSRKMYELNSETIFNQFICWFSSQADYSAKISEIPIK